MLSRFDTLPPSSSTSCSYLLYMLRAAVSFTGVSWNAAPALGHSVSFQWLGKAVLSAHVLALLFGKKESFPEAVHYPSLESQALHGSLLAASWRNFTTA